MSDDVLVRRVWDHWSKKGAAHTASPVLLYPGGHLGLPAAIVAALGFAERVHLFVGRHAAGSLWICPAAADDASAYRLWSGSGSNAGDRRATTVAGLFDALEIAPELDVARGAWTVEAERIVVQFEVAS